MIQNSYNSFDYKPIAVIPVIASFDTKGHIKPLYVRIGEKSYKIESFWIRHQFVNTTEFHCQILVDGYKKPLLLTYYQSEGVWGIPP